MKLLLVVLVLSALALLAVAIAGYARIRRYMKASETTRLRALEEAEGQKLTK